MTRILILITLLLLTFTQAIAQTGHDQVGADNNSNIEQEFRSLVREMHDTLLRCDKERLLSFFADDFIGTSYEGYTTNKDQLTKTFRCAPPEVKVSRDIEDHRIRRHGDTVIVSYRVVEHVTIGGKSSDGRYLYTDVFVKRAGRWQMISSHSTRLRPERKAAKVDPKIFDDYVGRYAAEPKAIFTITREGDKLVGQAPDGSRVEFLAESETTFFVEGRDIQVVFERDRTGQVARMIIKRDSGDLKLDRIH